MSTEKFSELHHLSQNLGFSPWFLPMLCVFLTLVLGLIFGSFVNVCIYRIPKRESVVFGRSHCTACGAKIKDYDLIPVVSYLFLKGKCRSCGAKISLRYPIIEGANALLYLAMLLRFGVSPEFFGYCALASALLGMSVIDLETQTIPDSFPLFLLADGVFLSVFASDIPWPDRVIGLFAVSIPLLTVFFATRGGMGLGDVKLTAAAGLCIGWRLSLLSALLGCVVAAAAGLWMIRFKPGVTRKTAIAFGPFLAGAMLLSVLCGKELLAWYLSLFSA